MGQTTPKRGRSPQLGNLLFFYKGNEEETNGVHLIEWVKRPQSGVVTQS